MHVGPQGAPVNITISYSLKKKRLFIVDYIKPSPVYQVKRKLVMFANALTGVFIEIYGNP